MAGEVAPLIKGVEGTTFFKTVSNVMADCCFGIGAKSSDQVSMAGEVTPPRVRSRGEGDGAHHSSCRTDGVTATRKKRESNGFFCFDCGICRWINR